MRKALAGVCLFCTGATTALQAADHTVLATPQTVEWGWYDSETKPVQTVHSGDTVRMQTLSTCGSREDMVKLGVKPEEIPPYTDTVYAQMPKDVGPGGHILTGPVAIAEAEPGDVLEVQISMGISPPDGKVDSGPSFAHAGNLDNKELVAGTTLYIPVAAKGALFEVGDGHAGQGNGEVDIEALETYLSGTFRFIVHKNRRLIWPRAETPEYYISMGFSKDLKEATEHAVRDMIAVLMEEKHLSPDDAYMLTSVAVDVDITQLVDGNVGVRALLPKKIFTGAPGR